MNHNLFFFPFIFFFTVYGISKDELLVQLNKHAPKVKQTYQTSMCMKISDGNGMAVSDSGILASAPDGCTYIKLFKSNTEQWICHDTSWQKNLYGGISRSKINGEEQNQFSAPDISNLIKEQHMNILRSDSNSVLIETITTLDKDQKFKMHLLVDKKEWLLRKTIVFAPGSGPVETGYSWQKFGSAPVIKEIATVMPMGGFVKITFSDYKKIKQLPNIR